MQSAASRAADRNMAAANAAELEDIEFLLDEISAWQGRLHDTYRGRLSDAAAGLHDALSNAAGELMAEQANLENYR